MMESERCVVVRKERWGQRLHVALRHLGTDLCRFGFSMRLLITRVSTSRGDGSAGPVLLAPLDRQRLLRRKCRNTWVHRGITFWRAVRLGRGLSAALGQVENEEIKRRIRTTLAKRATEVDNDHQLIKALTNRRKKFVLICRTCIAATLGSRFSYSTPCTSEVVARSMKFRQAVEKQGNLEETLAQMTDMVGTEVKKWMEQKATGQHRGHSLPTVNVDINTTVPLYGPSSCVRGAVRFSNDCQGQMIARSDTAWKAIRSKGSLAKPSPSSILPAVTWSDYQNH